MTKSLGKPVIDFNSYITERTINFTGREWVFQAINNWLADPDGSRFFLLRGEPGSGKTAISARLSQFAKGTVSPPDGLVHLHPDFLSALHFCSARDNRWIDPRIFAKSLALQLAERYPVYAKALLEKSGDRSIRIEVQQHIEQGQGVGVLINKLDVSGASPEDAFNRVVREPLEALLHEGWEGQVVILVDALDEAMSSTITPTIVALLSQTDNLPSHVRFILTTRQESRVENKIRNVNELSLSIPNDQRNQIDIAQYVQGRRAVDRELAVKTEQMESKQITQFVEVVSSKAEGNFLYARFLLDAMAKGLRPLSEMDGLPTGLDELYFDSLNRVVELGKRDWFTEYRPLMGVLSVAQESFTLAQLQAFTTQPRSSIWQYLSDLQQFIQEANSQDVHAEHETRYRLYHQSVIDFLGHQSISIEQRHLPNNYYIPPDEWHKKLANICEQGDLSIIWDDIKHNVFEQSRREYARKYYITHLYLAQDWQRLFEVLDSVQYGKAKIRSDPSTRSYALDLDLGRQATIWEGWTIEEGLALLPRLWQYTLLHCSLMSRAVQYPEEAFRLLVSLGRKQEAIELAELLAYPSLKVRVLLYIAEQLREKVGLEYEWIETLMRACEVARTIRDSFQQARELPALITALAHAQQWERAEHIIATITDSAMQANALRTLSTALIQAQQWEQAERVIATIKDGAMQARELIALGTALAQTQQWEWASQMWERAERAIATIVANTVGDSRWKSYELRVLATALIQAQQWERAEHVIATIRDSDMQAKSLTDLGASLVQAQQWEQSSQAWEQAERVIATIKDGFQKVDALIILVTALAWAQQWERTSQMWERAEHIIATFRGSNYLDNMLGFLVTALIQAQQWEQAERVIAFGNSRWQAGELIVLSTALAQAQQWEQAERVITTIRDSHNQAKALSVLGTELAQARQWERASKVLEQAEHVITTIGDSYAQAFALSVLGNALAQAKQWKQALLVWERTKRIIATFRGHYYQAYELNALVTALAKARQWEQAERVIATSEDIEAQTEALGALVTALVQAQQWEQAERVITTTIKYSFQQTEALSALVTALAQAQQWERALLLWEQAERIIIVSFIDSYQQVEVLGALVTALANADELEQLLHLIQREWRKVKTSEEALFFVSIASTYISSNPQVSIAFIDAFTWVDTFLSGGELNENKC